MLRGRSTLASVFLCSVCLLALSSQRSSGKLCSKDLVQRVKSLRIRTLNQISLNTSLYTPTIDKYQSCPSSALTCFAEEVKVLITELDISGFPFRDQVSSPLQRLAKQMDVPKINCTQCEVFEVHNLETFLSSLEKFINAVNTMYC